MHTQYSWVVSSQARDYELEHVHVDIGVSSVGHVEYYNDRVVQIERVFPLKKVSYASMNHLNWILMLFMDFYDEMYFYIG